MFAILLILSFSMQVKSTQPIKPVKPVSDTFVYPEKFKLGSNTPCTDPIPSPTLPNCTVHVRRVQSMDGYVYCLVTETPPLCTYPSPTKGDIKK